MTELADVIDISEAAAIAGRTPAAIRSAMIRGSLPAKRLGSKHRGNWVTTREELTVYLAYSAKRAVRRKHGGNGRFLSRH